MNILDSEEVIVLNFISRSCHMLSTRGLWVDATQDKTGEATNFTGANMMCRICYAFFFASFIIRNDIYMLGYLLSAVVALALHGYQMVMALSLLVMLMGTCMCMKKWVLN